MTLLRPHTSPLTFCHDGIMLHMNMRWCHNVDGNAKSHQPEAPNSSRMQGDKRRQAPNSPAWSSAKFGHSLQISIHLHSKLFADIPMTHVCIAVLTLLQCCVSSSLFFPRVGSSQQLSYVHLDVLTPAAAICLSSFPD